RRLLPLRVALLEAVDAAGGVDQLLFAGEEGVALRADLDAQLFTGGAGGPGLAAGAVDGDILIFRVNFWLHERFLTSRVVWKTPSIREKVRRSGVRRPRRRCRERRHGRRTPHHFQPSIET